MRSRPWRRRRISPTTKKLFAWNAATLPKTYTKSLDLTKDGHAEPAVDELASAPLDLWAREHGYAKLHAHLLGLDALFSKYGEATAIARR